MAAQTRYVLVTGCSDGGIGPALAKAFHDKGLHVFASARDLNKMQSLKDLQNITFVELDVTSQPSIDAAYTVVEKISGGKLHYLVNNSGAGYVVPFLDANVETSQRMFDVNVWGVVRTTQKFAPLVISTKGTIVNNISVVATLTLPWQSMYSGSKAAIGHMTEILKLEMKPFGVKVAGIYTGVVSTHLFSKAPELQIPQESYYTPIKDDIARVASGETMPKGTKADVYANQVVGDILGGAEGKIWRGATSSLARFMIPLLPEWLKNSLLSDGTGLPGFRP